MWYADEPASACFTERHHRGFCSPRRGASRGRNVVRDWDGTRPVTKLRLWLLARGTCTSSRFRLYLLLPCTIPSPSSADNSTAYCRKSSCVTGIAIFRDAAAASTFSTRLTPNSTRFSCPSYFFLTHHCYGPCINLYPFLFSFPSWCFYSSFREYLSSS